MFSCGHSVFPDVTQVAYFCGELLQTLTKYPGQQGAEAMIKNVFVFSLGKNYGPIIHTAMANFSLALVNSR